MTFYVKRAKDAQAEDPMTGTIARPARTGWTGPIRSAHQARREASAWQGDGWTVEVVESTPTIRAEVRAWQRERDIAHGRRSS